jgi:hypothetical protein
MSVVVLDVDPAVPLVVVDVVLPPAPPLPVLVPPGVSDPEEQALPAATAAKSEITA